MFTRASISPDGALVLCWKNQTAKSRADSARVRRLNQILAKLGPPIRTWSTSVCKTSTLVCRWERFDLYYQRPDLGMPHLPSWNWRLPL